MYNLHNVILHCDSHLSHGCDSMAVECLCCCAPPKPAAPQHHNSPSPAAKHATLHHLACCGASEKQIHRETTRKPAKPAQITCDTFEEKPLHLELSLFLLLEVMLLGKLDSDSDSDCPDALSGYKPRRLKLSDSEKAEKHNSRPSGALTLGAFGSSSSLLNEHQKKAAQFTWELLCRREGGVLVC
jgi:hypothetical protein